MEKAVRDAAVALQKAIADAVAAGFVVEWPNNALALDKIAISATGKVKPTTFGGGRPPVPGEFGTI